MYYKTLISSCVFLLLNTLLYSQSIERCIVSTAGNILSNESLSIEFAIGDIATETLKTEHLILTQGFLQADFKVKNNIDSKTLEKDWNLYPNPAKNRFNLILNEIPSIEKQELHIVDLNGRLVLHNELKLQHNIINIQNIQPGTYIIKIYNNREHNSKTRLLQIIE